MSILTPDEVAAFLARLGLPAEGPAKIERGDFAQYVTGMRAKRLPADEQRALAFASQRGDLVARDKLIRSVAPLVARFTYEFVNGRHDRARLMTHLADLFGEQLRIALVAISTYDGRNAVSTHVGSSVKENLRIAARRKFSVGGVHTPEWIYSRGDGKPLPAFKAHTLLPDELNPCARTEPPSTALAAAEHMPQARAAIKRLKGIEHTLLTLRYGLAGEPPLTLEAAAERVGLSRLAARKIEAKALGRFQEINDGPA